MATLNLSGQNLERADIAPKLLRLKNLMEQRKPLWQKASYDKRKKWVQSDKDPIMGIAWDVYKYLRDNFFGGQDDI